MLSYHNATPSETQLHFITKLAPQERKKARDRQTEESFFFRPCRSFGRSFLPGHLSVSMPAVRLRWGVSQTLHASSSTLAALGTSSSCEGRSGENQMDTFCLGLGGGSGGGGCEGWVAVGFFLHFFFLFWFSSRGGVPVESRDTWCCLQAAAKWKGATWKEVLFYTP